MCVQSRRFYRVERCIKTRVKYFHMLFLHLIFSDGMKHRKIFHIMLSILFFKITYRRCQFLPCVCMICKTCFSLTLTHDWWKLKKIATKNYLHSPKGNIVIPSYAQYSINKIKSEMMQH